MIASATSAAEPAREIVDAHVHFYDPTRPQGIPWPESKTDPLYRPVLPGPWAAMVRPLGVSGVIVVEASAWLEDNQWVLDLAKDNPIIRGFVGHLEPGKPEFRGNLARFARNPIFRGIRLGEQPIRSALSDAATMTDLQRLADSDLALDAIGSGPMLIGVARLSDRIPNLRIVVDHLPFDSPKGALQELRGRPRVFAKVSGALRQINGRVPEHAVSYRRELDELWNVFGESRVVYASNWPVCEHFGSYETVLQVVREYFEAKGEKAAQKFFRTNSQAAYRWS